MPEAKRPPFDMAWLDTRTKSLTGAPMPLRNPATGRAMLTSEGEEVTITLRGTSSDEYEDKMVEIRRVRANRATRGVLTTAADERLENIDLLCALTVSWTIEVMDGEPFPCEPDNIRRLWSDLRFPWVADIAVRFVSDYGNFLRASLEA